MKVRVDYSDGRSWLTPWKQPEDPSIQWAGVEITDAQWRAYQNHVEIDNMWQRQLVELGNVQYELDNRDVARELQDAEKLRLMQEPIPVKFLPEQFDDDQAGC